MSHAQDASVTFEQLTLVASSAVFADNVQGERHAPQETPEYQFAPSHRVGVSVADDEKKPDWILSVCACASAAFGQAR